MKKLLLILLCFPFLVFSQNEKRLALVICNANCDKTSLDNPVNDALLVAETLKKLDSDVILYTNITNKADIYIKWAEVHINAEAIELMCEYYIKYCDLGDCEMFNTNCK